MRLVTYTSTAGWRCGIDRDDGIADTQSVARAAGFTEADVEALQTNRDVGALEAASVGDLAAAAGADDVEVHARDAVRLGPPIPDPQKIICLGLNYRDHARESGLQPPAAPMFFAKFANSLVGPFDEIVPPASTQKVDYEAELAVVIGRRGRTITEADALAHVAGAMVLNDVSARDLQLANTLWTGGKAVDTFAPCGPSLVLMDEIADLQDLRVRARVNGEVVQDGTTASMIFGVASTIAFLSQIMTLEPGDIIATGTPAGVGQSRTPPLFLHTGDLVEVEIDGLGVLRNRIAAPIG
jgi:2-keto-4-pentenoate hydratase/2-oxohepta-3-ene-1,7-dioic acid hydratase in catechol pathway